MNEGKMESAVTPSMDDKQLKYLEEMKMQMMMTDFAQSQMQTSVNRTHGHVPPIEKAKQLASSAESKRQQFLEKIRREMETKKAAVAAVAAAATAPAPAKDVKKDKTGDKKKWKNIPIVRTKPKDPKPRKDIKVPASQDSCAVPNIPGAPYEIVPFKLLPSIANSGERKKKAQHLDGSGRPQKKAKAGFIPVKHTKKSAQIEKRAKAKSKANTECTPALRQIHALPGIVPGSSGQRKGTSPYYWSRKPIRSVYVNISASDWSTTCIASNTPKPNESSMSTLPFPQLGSTVLPPIGSNDTPKKSQVDQEKSPWESPGSSSSPERSTKTVSRRSKTYRRSRSRSPPLNRNKFDSPAYPARSSPEEITARSSASVTPRNSRGSQRSAMRNPRVLHSGKLDGNRSDTPRNDSRGSYGRKSLPSPSSLKRKSSAVTGRTKSSLDCSPRSNTSRGCGVLNNGSPIERPPSTKGTESAQNMGTTNVEMSPSQRSSSVLTRRSSASRQRSSKLSTVKSVIPTDVRRDATSRASNMSDKSTLRSVEKSSCPSPFSRSSAVSRKSSTPPASVTPRTPPSGKQSPGRVSTSVTPRTPPSGKQSPGPVSTYSNTSSSRTSAVSKIASPQNTRPASTTPTRKSSISEQSTHRSVGKSVCSPSKDAPSRASTRKSSVSINATPRSMHLSDASSRSSSRKSSVSICATPRSRPLADAPSRPSSRKSPVSICATPRSKPLADAPPKPSTRKSSVSICATPRSRPLADVPSRPSSRKSSMSNCATPRSKPLSDASPRSSTRKSSVSTCATPRSRPSADTPSRPSTRTSSVSICATPRSKPLSDASPRSSTRKSSVSTCATPMSRPLADTPSRPPTRTSSVSICATPRSLIRPATPAKARGSPSSSSSMARY